MLRFVAFLGAFASKRVVIVALQVMRIIVRIPMLGRSCSEINRCLAAQGPEAFNKQRQIDRELNPLVHSRCSPIVTHKAPATVRGFAIL